MKLRNAMRLDVSNDFMLQEKTNALLFHEDTNTTNKFIKLDCSQCQMHLKRYITNQVDLPNLNSIHFKKPKHNSSIHLKKPAICNTITFIVMRKHKCLQFHPITWSSQWNTTHWVHYDYYVWIYYTFHWCVTNNTSIPTFVRQCHGQCWTNILLVQWWVVDFF